MVAAANLLACDGHQIPPSPHLWVTDHAAFLSPGIAARLDHELHNYQEKTGHHVLVYISDEDLKHTPIEDYCLAAFNAWGVGRSGHDDGIVWFVFPKGDRLRMRIQVGYGLESALTDREAVSIMRENGSYLESHEMAQRDAAAERVVHQILSEIDQH